MTQPVAIYWWQHQFNVHLHGANNSVESHELMNPPLLNCLLTQGRCIIQMQTAVGFVQRDKSSFSLKLSSHSDSGFPKRHRPSVICSRQRQAKFK